MASGVAAACEVLDDVVHAPGFESAANSAVQPRRKPAVDRSTPEGAVTLVRAEDVFRRVACAAMGGASDQIAAAIPFRTFLLVRLEDAWFEEQEIPAAHHESMVERPPQFRRGPLVADGSKRREIGTDREQVVAGE